MSSLLRSISLSIPQIHAYKALRSSQNLLFEKAEMSNKDRIFPRKAIFVMISRLYMHEFEELEMELIPEGSTLSLINLKFGCIHGTMDSLSNSNPTLISSCWEQLLRQN
ncbi:unnamed protein product [Cuscuta epithymum]|uniref:Uncharacterized protein n=1 Tax=Cuscuta epithymum TaxID=186058 RepID=A0AAV0G2E2_9ASTE|nr:unnamed protein product [Cuscuta epithymum]